MNPLELVLVATFVIVAAAGLALVSARTSRWAGWIATCGAVVGGVLGLSQALRALALGWVGGLDASWHVPGGALIVGIDPLSAFFLVPLFALGPLCAVYGRRYLAEHPVAAAELNLLIGATALILLARHGLLFVICWEAMALLTYLLIVFDHSQREVRRAGWVYLIAAHVAMMALIGLFLVLAGRAGGALEFAAFADMGAATGRDSAGTVGLMLLALLGFGIKAGVIGLHPWLPEAHAAAPSHVSALMSAVLIKLGVYGMLRTALFVTAGRWFGIVLMVAGIFGAIFGIVQALYQQDLKRVLAYSSVENIGIILLGLGLGFWARAGGDGQLAAIAFGGALLHIWNHAAMKGLLFLCAGSILHSTGTKDVERLGGLLRSMPWTGNTMILGAVATAALPPLNGFASEWLVYRALTHLSLHGAGASGLAAMAGTAALALVGGLAAFCFVRIVGVVLLGTPRDEHAAAAHESPLAMTVPMTLLALACVAMAFTAPGLLSLLTPLIERLCATGTAHVAAAANVLSPVLVIDAVLLLGVGFLALALRSGQRWKSATVTDTWGCGYANPGPRMQYTGRAFSELFTSRVLPRWARSRLQVHAPAGVFASTASFSSHAIDPLTRSVYEPFLVRWAERCVRLRFLQRGSVHVYIVYIFGSVIAGLAWVAARDWLMP